MALEDCVLSPGWGFPPSPGKPGRVRLKCCSAAANTSSCSGGQHGQCSSLH